MSGLISEDVKRRVREANNLVDIVQGTVGKLTRAGHNLKACCPFHNEKTASFNVNVEGQYFKCFGCGKSGDVFTFIMLHERVEFPEALKILADRAGIPLEFDQKSAEQYRKETDWKSYLFKLNEAAQKFYREQLFADCGQAARAYLKKRGLSDAICAQFGLGYAPAGGSPLLARLQSQRAPVKAILLAGLASQTERGAVRDFFFDRLMFPIRDGQGRVIAFGGRILGDGEPKYLNTRETPLFSKTKTVYGLDLARDAIIKSRQAALVEGYTDVMMCHQFGVTNVVACLGTAITADHVRQLRRVADTLLMLTDSDAAGAKASERSLGVLFQEQVPARIVRLPGAAKDPCDFLLEHGKEPFVQALTKSLDLFDYKFERVCQEHDIATAHGQKAAADELMATISLIPDTLLKNRYRYEVQKRLNVDEKDLRYATVSRAAPDGERGAAADGVGNVPAPESELARAERELLRYLFHDASAIEKALGLVDLASLSGGPEGVIGRALLAAFGDGKLAAAGKDTGSSVAREVLGRLQEEGAGGIVKETGAVQLCIELAEAPPAGIKLDSATKLTMVVRPVLSMGLSLRADAANRRLARARQQGDSKAEKAASAELAGLTKEIAALKSSTSRIMRQPGG